MAPLARRLGAAREGARRARPCLARALALAALLCVTRAPSACGGAPRAAIASRPTQSAGQPRQPASSGDWRAPCDAAALLNGYRDDEPSFASSKWALRETEAYCRKCAPTHRMLQAYALPQYSGAPRRVLVVDGLLRWHGIGNTAAMFEPVWSLAAATRRAVYFRLADCDASPKLCLFDMGAFFRGLGGADWSWSSDKRREVEERLGELGLDSGEGSASNLFLWVDAFGMLYANASSTPDPQRGASMGHTVSGGRLVAFAEHSRAQWEGGRGPGAWEAGSGGAGLPEPLDYLRSAEVDSRPVVTLRLAGHWALHKAVAFHAEYALPWRRPGEEGADLPPPVRMDMGCLSFAMYRPVPRMQRLLAPYLARAEGWDGMAYIHSRIGVTDWIGERRSGAVQDVLGKASKDKPLECPFEDDASHLAAIEDVFRACGASGLEPPRLGDWQRPCVAWSEVGCKAVCRGDERPAMLTSGEAPTEALAEACSLGRQERFAMPGEAAGPLHAALTCAGRLAQGAAGGGGSEAFGVVLLTDIPALSAVYARLAREEASPLFGHALTVTHGALGHMRTRADETSCSAHAGCVVAGRDPQGIWTRTALDYYLGGIASHGVQLVHSSFFNAVTRRSTLFERRELWLGYERMSAPRVADDGTVRGKHGNRDSHLTNATLVAVLTQCTEVPDEV